MSSPNDHAGRIHKKVFVVSIFCFLDHRRITINSPRHAILRASVFAFWALSLDFILSFAYRNKSVSMMAFSFSGPAAWSRQLSCSSYTSTICTWLKQSCWAFPMWKYPWALLKILYGSTNWSSYHKYWPGGHYWPSNFVFYFSSRKWLIELNRCWFTGASPPYTIWLSLCMVPQHT